MKDFLHLTQTNANFELQQQRGSRGLYGTKVDGAEQFSEHEIQHISRPQQLLYGNSERRRLALCSAPWRRGRVREDLGSNTYWLGGTNW